MVTESTQPARTQEPLPDPMDMTADQLMQGGGPRTPLREFRGRFTGAPTDASSYDPTRRVVHLNFDQVVVLQATTPYNYPTAVIDINQSRSAGSGWGVFYDSFVKVAGKDKTLRQALNKTFHIKWTGGHDIGTMREDRSKRQIIEAWEVLDIEGMTTGPVVPPEETLAALLAGDGLTADQFVYQAMGNAAIKADPDIMAKLLDASLLNGWVRSGKVQQVEDRYQLVGS